MPWAATLWLNAAHSEAAVDATAGHSEVGYLAEEPPSPRLPPVFKTDLFPVVDSNFTTYSVKTASEPRGSQEHDCN